MAYATDSIVSYYCDVCGEYPLTPTRLTCINCSEHEVSGGTIDLCFKCFSANKHVTRGRDNKIHHPSHNIIQRRTVEWRLYRHSNFDYAKRLLLWAESQLKSPASTTAAYTVMGDSEDDGPGPSSIQCIVCTEASITGPPYWFCLDCRGMAPRLISPVSSFLIMHIFPTSEDAYVCYACNEKVEREKPWLFQRRLQSAPGRSPSEHNWSHILVSAPSPKQDILDADGEQALTAGEHIALLKERLAALSEQLETALGALLNKS